MAYFGRVEYPPSFENRAIVFDLSLCSVLLRLGSDSETTESDIKFLILLFKSAKINTKVGKEGYQIDVLKDNFLTCFQILG